jgi:hypothetical protein
MDIKQTSMEDLGLEYVKWPITDVRIHRTDGQWLVEYRRKPKWFLDKWWWFNDGKYVSYNDANARAVKLASQGHVLYTRYVQTKYVVTVEE